MATTFGRHLGKNVIYGGNDLDAWERQALSMLPAWMVFDFKIMYRYFQDHGLLATPADLEKAQKVVGHPPRSFDAFAAETVAAWNRA